MYFEDVVDDNESRYDSVDDESQTEETTRPFRPFDSSRPNTKVTNAIDYSQA